MHNTPGIRASLAAGAVLALLTATIGLPPWLWIIWAALTAAAIAQAARA